MAVPRSSHSSSALSNLAIDQVATTALFVPTQGEVQLAQQAPQPLPQRGATALPTNESFSYFYYTAKGRVGNTTIRLFLFLFLVLAASGDEHR